MRFIIDWFKTRILRQVVFKEDGYTPVECKGLQLISGKPLEKGAKYCVSSEWEDWDYIGKGRYLRKWGIALTTDTKNPYYLVGIKKAREKFFRGE